MEDEEKITTATREEILEEYIRRNPVVMRDCLGVNFKKYCTTPKHGKFHVKQYGFLTDETKNKVVCCSRRAGKSRAIVAKIVDMALREPQSLCLYISFTAIQAYEIAWNMFRELLHNEQIQFRENNNAKRITLSENESLIQCAGVDKRRELHKFLGKKYNLIVIDECQVFSHSIFKDFLVSILGPAGWDVGNAPMILVGTPNASCTGPFRDAWERIGQFHSFKRFHWTVHDNPFIEESAGKHVKRILAQWASDHGIRQQDPKYRREALGEWVRDELSMVYDFHEDGRNYYDQLPELEKNKRWLYVAGLDTGYTDADAIVVLAFHPEESRNVYLVEEYYQKKSGWEVLKKEIKRIHQQYDPIAIVIDSAAGGLKFTEDLIQILGLPVEPAEKAHKQSFIGLFNSDLRAGRYRIQKGAQIQEDFLRLEWEWKGQIKQVAKAYHGDLSDANLYAWRKCYHYLYEEKEKHLNEYEKLLKQWKTLRKEQVEYELEQLQNRQEFDRYLYMEGV